MFKTTDELLEALKDLNKLGIIKFKLEKGNVTKIFLTDKGKNIARQAFEKMNLDEKKTVEEQIYELKSLTFLEKNNIIKYIDEFEEFVIQPWFIHRMEKHETTLRKIGKFKNFDDEDFEDSSIISALVEIFPFIREDDLLHHSKVIINIFTMMKNKERD